MSNPVDTSGYGIKVESGLSFEAAVVKVTEELKNEGFGVLTEIDVKATLKKKLGKDMPRYLILGACNPNFANKAIEAEPDIGLLLPCNVIVHELNGKTIVAAVNPMEAMSVVKNDNMAGIAKSVTEALTRVIQALG